MFLFAFTVARATIEAYNKLKDQNEVRTIYLGELIYNLSIELNKRLEGLFHEEHLRSGQIHTMLHLYEMAYDSEPGTPLTNVKLKAVALEQLTKRMYIDKSNVSRNLKKVEDLGYVKREIIDQKTHIVFTASGAHMMVHLFTNMRTLAIEMVGNIAPEKIQETENILRMIMKNLNEGGTKS